MAVRAPGLRHRRDGRLNFWGISATVPIGPGELYAFWGNAADGTGGAANGTRVGQLTKGGGTGATQWELGKLHVRVVEADAVVCRFRANAQ